MSWDPLALFDALDESVAVYEPDGTVVYANPATQRLFGRGREELVGRRLWDLFPEAVGNPFHQALERVAASGQAESLVHHYTPWDRWFRNEIHALGGKIHVVASDITAQRRAEERLTALARASDALAAAADLDAAFAEIARVLAETIGDACELQVFQPGGAAPRVAARHDAADDHAGAPHATLVAPVRDRGRELGSLVLTRRRTARAFSDEDAELLRELGDRVGMVIARARLHDENARALEAERGARRAAERAAEQTRRLQAVTSHLSRRLPPHEVAETVLRESADLVGGTTAAIWILSPAGDRLEMLADVEYANREAFRSMSVDSDSPLGRAVRTAQPVYLANLDEYRALFPRSADRIAGQMERDFASACLPLCAEGRVLGGMAFAFWDPHPFSDDERRFLEVLANQCAQAFDRARLLDEERAASARLLESNRTLEAIISAAPTAIMLLDTDGTVRLWNRAAERTFGWTADEVMGKFLPTVPDDRRDELRANLANTAAHRPLAAAETRRLTRDRGLIDVSLFAAPVSYPDGTVKCLSVVVDVTDARREALRRDLLARASAVLASSLDSGEILQRLAQLAVPDVADWCCVDVVALDGAVDRVAVAHADPGKDDVARGLRRRLAPRPELRHGLSSAVAHGRAELVREVTDELLQAVARDEDHLRAMRRMNMRSYVCAPLVVAGRSLGAVTLVSSTRAYDESDLALVQELARRAASVLENARLYDALRELVRRLENVQAVTSELSRARTPQEVAAVCVRHGARAVQAETCLVWLAEPDGSLRLLESDGIVDVANAAWRHLPRDSGAPALAVLHTGEPMWIETAEQYERLTPDIFARQSAAGRVRAFAALPLTVAGEGGGVLVFSFPIGHQFTDDEKDFLLTLTRQCEQALERAQLFATEAAARAQAEEAQARAEAANRAKDEFLAMLGHELRNPLAPIMTALQLMKLRGDARSSKEQQIIERQMTHVVRLVDDLLDVSRITRGKIQLKREPLELADAVAKAVEIASPLLEQKQHRLDVSVPRQGLRLLADPVRLEQVIANLLTNAARYTPPGGAVSVTAARDGGDVVLTVEDSGTGIDPELLPRIFDLFVQGVRSSERGQGGLGIGLTLVRNLVAMHGGTVSARSDGPGRGSAFTLRLPALPGDAPLAAAPPPPEPAIAAARSRRVLVVDENVDAAEVLAEFLRIAGHDVVLAYDGAQALRAIETFSPEVAIVDIGLPVMDGYELATRLRERLPVRMAALTGYGQDHDRTRSMSAGFHAHFVKPIAPEVLLEYVDG